MGTAGSVDRLQAARVAQLIVEEVKKAVKGKDDIIEKVLLAILARGHILLEDIPGVGKTTMALAFSRVMQLEYNRVQFTPDVMPSDVTGYSVYRKSTDRFEFVRGAALCNLFLADEINRTSSKTQSALLEVMEEGHVTVDLKTYETPKPFTVIATQNPTGSAGTQMLPESQLDRFLVRLSMGYPDADSEVEILMARASDSRPELRPVISAAGMLQMQEAVDQVYMVDAVYRYIVELVSRTRSHELIELGASPRGSIALARFSKAKAFFEGRDYVLPSDVAYSLESTLVHRLLLRPKAKVAGKTAGDVLEEIRSTVPAPHISI